MCNFSDNLVAWLDRELPPEEEERTRRHLEDCSECRSRVDTYRQVTLEFDSFCDERMTSSIPPQALRWPALISATGAIAAVVALLILTPSGRVRHPVVAPQGQTISVAPAVSTAEPLPLLPRRVEKAHRNQAAEGPVQIRRSNARARDESTSALPYEPVIKISIPAEEMFPPGAVPAGMGFAADVAIGADGSADRLRLQPRLVGFERGISI